MVLRWMVQLCLCVALCGAVCAQEGGSVSPSQGQAASAESDGSAAAGGAGGGFVFKAEAREVVLQATVVDEHEQPVTTLGREAFQVFEDGKPQEITSFRREDIPVALAILIDDSGSMREKRSAVNDAALNLVRASNPQDEVCIVNFADTAFLDQDFTDDVALLSKALEHIESRGGTALYDAVVAASAHLRKSAKLERKVILVVTDGEDTASNQTLEQAVHAVSVQGGPTVYTIGLLGGKREKTARRALEILAQQSGGVAYFPSTLGDVNAVTQGIAQELRHQYIIAYRPSESGVLGEYRRLVVKATAHGYKGLVVRTRSGYFVSESESSPGAR